MTVDHVAEFANRFRKGVVYVCEIITIFPRAGGPEFGEDTVELSNRWECFDIRFTQNGVSTT